MKIIFMLFCFIFWSVKVLFFHYFFKYAKLAKFIRYEALWELSFKQTFFYHKVHGEQVKWWRFWVLWGTSEILHYSTLRSEWHGSVFYSRLGIWIIFETQRFFIIPMFLRKQSRNSLANWWSVCFKMFFSNGFICGVASTGSATVYENYFYAQPPCMKIIFMLFCFIF